MVRALGVSPRRIRACALVLPAIAATGCAATEAAGITAATATTEAVPLTEPVSVTDLATGGLDDPVEISVGAGAGEGVQVVFRKIVLAPGARTGEHCHHGQLVAVVEQGELTHYAPVYEDGVHVYRAGDAIIEGAGYVHEGVNEGSDDVVLLVTYLIENGEPLAESDVSRCAD